MVIIILSNKIYINHQNIRNPLNKLPPFPHNNISKQKKRNTSTRTTYTRISTKTLGEGSTKKELKFDSARRAVRLGTWRCGKRVLCFAALLQYIVSSGQVNNTQHTGRHHRSGRRRWWCYFPYVIFGCAGFLSGKSPENSENSRKKFWKGKLWKIVQCQRGSRCFRLKRLTNTECDKWKCKHGGKQCEI